MDVDKIPLGRYSRRQHPIFGCSLQVIGFVLFLVAVCLDGAAILPNNTLTFGQWLVRLVVFSVLAIAAFYLGRNLRRYGRRHTVRIIRTLAEAREKRTVLYLRPFGVDAKAMTVAGGVRRNWWSLNPTAETVEENLAQMFKALGKLIAAGQPDEKLPLPGAARLYLPYQDWEPVVQSLIDEAQLILLATGTSPGLLWELAEVRRRRKPHHVVLVVFSDEAEYEQLRKLACSFLELPTYPSTFRPVSPSNEPLIRGFVFFGADWRGNFVRMDPTVSDAYSEKRRWREMVAIRLQPALEKLFYVHFAEEQQAEAEDRQRRVALTQLEDSLDRFLEKEDGRAVPLRARLTPGFGIAEIGWIESPPESLTDKHDAAPAALPATDARGGAAYVIDIPAGKLRDALRQARKRGAGNSETLRVAGLNWTRSAVRIRFEPTGIELFVFDAVFGLAHSTDHTTPSGENLA